MRASIICIVLTSLIVSAVPVVDKEKRQNAEFDYVIVGVSHTTKPG